MMKKVTGVFLMFCLMFSIATAVHASLDNLCAQMVDDGGYNVFTYETTSSSDILAHILHIDMQNDTDNYGHMDNVYFELGYVPFNPDEETIVIMDYVKFVIIDEIQYSLSRQFPVTLFRRTFRTYCFCWLCQRQSIDDPNFTRIRVGAIVMEVRAGNLLGNAVTVFTADSEVTNHATPGFNPNFRTLQARPLILGNNSSFVEVTHDTTFRTREGTQASGGVSMFIGLRGLL